MNHSIRIALSGKTPWLVDASVIASSEYRGESLREDDDRGAVICAKGKSDYLSRYAISRSYLGKSFIQKRSEKRGETFSLR